MKILTTESHLRPREGPHIYQIFDDLYPSIIGAH